MSCLLEQALGSQREGVVSWSTQPPAARTLTPAFGPDGEQQMSTLGVVCALEEVHRGWGTTRAAPAGRGCLEGWAGRTHTVPQRGPRQAGPSTGLSLCGWGGRRGAAGTGTPRQEGEGCSPRKAAVSETREGGLEGTCRRAHSQHKGPAACRKQLSTARGQGCKRGANVRLRFSEVPPAHPRGRVPGPLVIFRLKGFNWRCLLWE